MRYRLSEHAQHALLERQIPRACLEAVLDHPVKVEADRDDPKLEHRLGRISEHGNRVLRVILRPSADPPVIVTAYFDRAMMDRL